MRSYQMVVSKKEGGEYKPVGSVAVFYPELSELGFDVQPTGYEVLNDKGEVSGTSAEGTGFPVYADDKVQYLFDAALSSVKAAARNKLVSGTVTLKEGNKIAETVEELLATAERSGEALKNRREFLDAFKKFLATTGKSLAVQEAISRLVAAPANIPLQPDSVKDKLPGYLANFATTLNAEQAAKYGRYLVAIEEQCQGANALLDM